jgi:membrane protein DedA with SNARE-associated domain
VPDLSDFLPFLWAFLALVAAGIGAPIPEELPVIGAGIWVASTPELGPFRWLILPVCIAGVLISDVMLYGIGRLWGPLLLKRPWVARWVPPDKRARIEENFHHYGIKILLFIRWLPGIRSPMFITAGLMRVPLLRFVIADGLAAVIGHSLLFFLAYWFGDQFRELIERAEARVDRLRPILILTAIALVGVYFLIHYWRQPVTTGDPKELPLIGEKVAATIESLDSKASFMTRHSGDGAAPAADNQAARPNEERIEEKSRETQKG